MMHNYTSDLHLVNDEIRQQFVYINNSDSMQADWSFNVFIFTNISGSSAYKLALNCVRPETQLQVSFQSSLSRD